MPPGTVWQRRRNRRRGSDIRPWRPDRRRGAVAADEQQCGNGEHADHLHAPQTVCSWLAKGSLRRRLPVAAKIALPKRRRGGGGSGLADAARLLRCCGSDRPRSSAPRSCAAFGSRGNCSARPGRPRKRDLVIERGAQPQDHAALDLRLDRVGIDDRAAIDRDDHTARQDFALRRHLDLAARSRYRCRRRIAPRRRARARPAAACPNRRFLGRELEAGQCARVLLQHGAAEGDRVLLGRGGQFVDEAFDHEDIMRRADAAPPAGVDAVRLQPDIFRMLRRHVVGRVADRGLDRVGVEPVLPGRRAPSAP